MAPSLQAKCSMSGLMVMAPSWILSRPAKPVENGYIESFNGRLRDELLNTEIFYTLTETKEKLEAWLIDYYTQRPTSSLGYRTPAEYAHAQVAVSKPLKTDTTLPELTLALAQ